MRYEEFKALRLRVLQPEGVERFGIDAILLADFASRRLHKSDRLLDLGTGSGIVALLLLARGISYAAGVEIYEYTPGFVHALVCVSDDEKAVVGTINLD